MSSVSKLHHSELELELDSGLSCPICLAQRHSCKPKVLVCLKGNHQRRHASHMYDCSLRRLKAPTHQPDVQLPYPTTLRPLCCLSSDPFGRKLALNTPIRRAASSTVACTFCAGTRCNNRVTLVLKTLYWRFMHATLFTFDQNET